MGAAGGWEWHHLLLPPSDPWGKYLLPGPTTLCSASREVLVPAWGNASTELGVKTAACSLWAPHASESTRQRKEFWCCLGWLVLTKMGKSDCFSMEVRKNVWSTGNPLGHDYPTLWLRSMENDISPIQAGLLMAQTLQERGFGSPQQVKNHNQVRCLLKVKGVQTG